MAPLSYAQRFEDFYLMRCFGGRASGFYIDIGSGHPVYDNVSFAFYLKGWRGITVEPNPWLSRLSRAVRVRDRHIETLVGATSGQGTFYRVEDFHGLSTMFESNARAAQREFGKDSQAIPVQVTTLADICAAHAPASIDFLKVDVEGAEKDVLFGGDWQKFRPQVVLAEALAPYTLAPAWPDWEPFLARHGYRYVWFDTLNRYYVAEEAGALAQCFEGAPETFDADLAFRNLKPALEDEQHPDHRLATVLRDAPMTELPVLDRDAVLELLTAGLPATELDGPAGPEAAQRLAHRLFGTEPAAIPGGLPSAGASVRDLYARLIETDAFRTACGRISASYAW